MQPVKDNELPFSASICSGSGAVTWAAESQSGVLKIRPDCKIIIAQDFPILLFYGYSRLYRTVKLESNVHGIM